MAPAGPDVSDAWFDAIFPEESAGAVGAVIAEYGLEVLRLIAGGGGLLRIARPPQGGGAHVRRALVVPRQLVRELKNS